MKSEYVRYRINAGRAHCPKKPMKISVPVNPVTLRGDRIFYSGSCTDISRDCPSGALAEILPLWAAVMAWATDRPMP